MNSVNLIGNLTATPELRKSPQNKSVCQFTIAVNDDYNRDKTDFIVCAAWETLAEHLCQYQAKGNKIAVTGKLKVDTYTDRNGNNRTKWHVRAEKIEFLDRKKTEEKNVQQTLNENDRDTMGFRMTDISDDELPFM